MILTALTGTNDELIERVAKLYLKPGWSVADVTFGRGVFWKRVDLSRYVFFASDINPVSQDVKKADLRALPYPGDSMDAVILDPPYMHSSKYRTVKASISKCYANNETPVGFGSHREVIALYADGMREARRILRTNGLLWVKCQDEIESGRQKWSHIEIYLAARDLGFEAEDLFVLVQATRPAQRWPHQHHARKNHSYLWIFRKRPTRAKEIADEKRHHHRQAR